MPPKPGRPFPHGIYVLHRSVVFGKPEVRAGMPSDFPALRLLARTFQRSRAAVIHEMRCAYKPDTPRWLKPFTFMLGGEIIGTCIVSEEDDVPSLMAHYEVNRHINAYVYSKDEFGHVRVGFISPMFQKFIPYFFREITRQTGLRVLFHGISADAEEVFGKNDEVPQGPQLCPSFLITEMVPVMPRPMQDIEFSQWPNVAGDTEPVLRAALSLVEVPYALFLMTPRIAIMGRRSVNLQIVIIGASDTAISFLQNLIFSPTSQTVRYSNLTLISTSPLVDWIPSPFVDLFRPYSAKYSRQFIARLGLRIWVNVVVSKVKTIDRENRVLRTTEGEEIPYDLLYLFPGEQFGPPRLVPSDKTDDKCKRYVAENFGKLTEESRSVEEEEPLDDLANVFYINSEKDVIESLVRLSHGIHDSPKYLIVLYGEHMATYCYLSGLLNWGVPGENMVVIVEELHSEKNNVFFDAEVRKAVLQSMENEGVAMLTGYSLRSWQVKDVDLLTLRPEPHAVSLTFAPMPGAVQIAKSQNPDAYNTKILAEGMSPIGLTFYCMALFCFSHRKVDRILRGAICDSGLILNRRLIVDRLGNTNDPRIKASGPLIRMTRRNVYARDARLCSSHELGFKLAQTMRRIWDPVERDRVYIRSIPTPIPVDASSPKFDHLAGTDPVRQVMERWGIEPTYRSRMASAIRAALGSYLKYSSVSPSLVFPICMSCMLPGGWYYYIIHRPGKGIRKISDEYVTGKCAPGEGPYCRVMFGPGKLLDYICILSETPVPRRFIHYLYGQHLETVGPLRKSKNILDSFVRPAVIARTMSRRIEDGSASDLETLFGFPSCILVSTVEKVLSRNGWQELTPNQLNALRREFFNSPQQQKIEDVLRSYFEAHGLDLPPEQVRMYLKASLHYAAS